MIAWLARNVGMIALLLWVVIPHWQFDPWVHLLLAIALIHLLFRFYLNTLELVA